MKKSCIIGLLLCLSLVFFVVFSASSEAGITGAPSLYDTYIQEGPVYCVDQTGDVVRSYNTGGPLITLLKDGQRYYVITDEDSNFLHEPIPYEIYEEDGIYDNGLMIDIYCISYGSEPGEKRGCFGIHFLENNTFSGFIYTDFINPQEGTLVVADHYRYGVVDNQGKYIVPCQWAWADGFKNGLCRVTYEAADEYVNCWVDRSGRIVSLDPEYGYAIQEGAESDIAE